MSNYGEPIDFRVDSQKIKLWCDAHKPSEKLMLKAEHTDFFDSRSGMIVERMTACVNALAGVPDDQLEEVVAAGKEAVLDE